MSVQPFNSLRQADDFFTVVLNTANSLNASKSNPRWNINPSGAVCDRYKLYKRCIGVVNWIDLQPDTNFNSGKGLVIRDTSNQQMNSSDSLTNQSNIIYFLQPVNPNDQYTITTHKNLKLENVEYIVDRDTNSSTYLNTTDGEADFSTFSQANNVGPVGNAKHNYIRVGHPFEKVNPFGNSELTLTLSTSTTPIAPSTDWVIHMTYYFYYN